MEFIDEESRPRFVLHSRSSVAISSPTTAAAASKLHVAACIAGSAILFFLAFYSSQESQVLFALLVWISISLLISPFAPASVTGGDVRVGIGEILPPPEDPPEEPKKRGAGSKIRPKRSSEDLTAEYVALPVEKEKINGISPVHVAVSESEWTNEDFEILKKQMGKYPVGTPGRWEKVAEVFKDRHGLESVIKEAKTLGQRKPSDSFGEFLRQRKNLDKRIDDVNFEFSDGSAGWSNAEDVALLNALKAFPKDAPLRWENIAAAVSGKSKADCLKRISELKKDFRSSKAS